MLDGHPGKSLVVEIDKRVGRAKVRASMRHERKIGLEHHAYARVKAFGARKNHAVGQPVPDDVVNGSDTVALDKVGSDRDVVSGSAERRGQTVQQDVGEAEELVVRVYQE